LGISIDVISDTVGLSFSPLGDRALLLEVGDHANAAVIGQVRALAEHVSKQQLPGVFDLVPAMCTLGVHYDPELWHDNTGQHSPYEMLVSAIQRILPDLESLTVTEGQVHEIPVCYDTGYGEDLSSLARAHDLTTEQVVAIHSSPEYTVYMLGFAPGFAYLGKLDGRLVSPRRETPRPRVPAGSIAVANEYTGIYPAALPGGWHIIGRTPLQLFDVLNDQPSLLSAGDRVKFAPISAARYRTLENSRQ